jgi:hypothetical protein
MTTFKRFRARDPEDPERYLMPIAHQRALQLSESLFTLLAGGWGAGKTVALLAFCEWMLFTNPGCLGIVIEPDYKKVRDFIDNKFKVAFRDYIIGESRMDSMIFLEGGRRVLYVSGHKLETLEQFQAAWLAADEVGLMKADLMPRAAARVRDPRAVRRRIGFVGTPHWGWLADAFDGRNDAQRKIIHVSTTDNPYLDQAYLDGLYDTCPGTMAEAYIHGHFVPPGGTVYGEYDPKIHHVKWKYDPKYPVGASIDWGSRTPHVLFFQIVPENTKLSTGKITTHESAIVFDELYPDGRITRIRTDDLCDQIVDKKYPLSKVCVDPTGFAQIEISHERLRVPINFIRRSKRVKVTVGIEHVSRMLRPYRGEPRLYFADSLAQATNPRAVCNAIRSYSYGKDEEGRPLREEPQQDGVSEHATSGLRYIAINYFPAVRPKAGVRSMA